MSPPPPRSVARPQTVAELLEVRTAFFRRKEVELPPFLLHVVLLVQLLERPATPEGRAFSLFFSVTGGLRTASIVFLEHPKFFLEVQSPSQR